MKNTLLLFILCFFVFGSMAQSKPSKKSLSRQAVVQNSKFEKIMDMEGISTYRNVDKSVRVIKRRQKTALRNLQLDRKTLRSIAEARFKALELLEMGFHDFNIINVSNASVSLTDTVKAYVWSGSYKDKDNKVRFFKEFITEGWTWNVYTDKEKDLKKALESVKEVIGIRSKKK